MEKAVIDRFEDQNLAVILVGRSEQEYHVSRNRLPAELKEGSHVLVVIENKTITSVTFDEEATTESSARIQSKMEKLREMKKMKRRSK